MLFPPGRCLMLADAETLELACESREERGVPAIKGIIDDHLERFAWREELEYEWAYGAPTDRVSILEAEDFIAEDEQAPEGGTG